MASPYDLLIRGGTCVLHRGLARVDLGVIAGRIAAIGELDPDGAAQVLDARGLHVLPGVIDTQVQLREPGLDPGGTLSAGTRAAVLGGVTSVLELPDTRPPTVTAAALEDKISRARAGSWCDFACFLGASHEAEEQGRLERLPGCAGLAVAVRSPGPGDDELLLRALSRGHRRVSVHVDDDARRARATQRVLGLARRAGRRVHLMRLTSAEECDLATQHRDLATAAVAISDLGDPGDHDLRSGTTAALWQAVQDGVVDLVATAPPTRRPDGDATASGQPLLPTLLAHLHAGRLGLTHLVELLAGGPARAYNIARKGRLALGLDADLCLVDLRVARDLGDDWSAEPPPRTPRVRATVLRGQVLARDGELVGEQDGNPLRFADTLRMVAL